MRFRVMAALVAAACAACSAGGPLDAGEDGGVFPDEDGGVLDGGVAARDGGASADGGSDGGAADGGVDDRTWPAPDFTRRVPSQQQEPALGVNVFFSPVDDTRGVVLRELERTRRKLHIVMFNLRDAQVGSKLLALHDGGLPIQILWDKKQADEPFNDMDDTLEAAGIDVRRIEITRATDAALHDKFAIFDDARVLTGSANWSVTGFTQNHEHILTMEGGPWPTRFEAEYQEILAGRADPGTYDASAPMNVLFGPEDRLDERVIDRISRAQTSIFVAMFDLTHTGIVDALKRARQRNVRVIFVIDKGQADDSTLDEDLESAGVVVVRGKPSLSAAKMHEKYSVYDDEWVILGSYNWTTLATFYNEENLVEIRSRRLAARVTGNFLALLRTFDPTFTDVERPPAKYGFSPTMVQVRFEVQPPPLRTGDALYLGGDAQALGGWERARALPMTRRADGWWEVTVSLPAGRTVEYKYLVRDRFGELHWEGGPKHTYLPVFTPALQPWADVYLEPPQG
jgi:phosphatidylserine/phosphatidylglycerophosphate/cardiolipin synthase-like enzyme